MSRALRKLDGGCYAVKLYLAPDLLRSQHGAVLQHGVRPAAACCRGFRRIGR